MLYALLIVVEHQIFGQLEEKAHWQSPPGQLSWMVTYRQCTAAGPSSGPSSAVLTLPLWESSVLASAAA